MKVPVYLLQLISTFFVTVFLFNGTLMSQETSGKRKNRQSAVREENAQNQRGDDYYDSGFLRYEDFIYTASLRTVLFHREGWELTPPILLYNSDEKLKLSFDDLDADYKVWQYTVIHCDAAWNPTDLWQNEYIEGFTEDYIRDYQYSFNTLQSFTHYNLILPNDNLRFTLPGNYLLKVYPEGMPDYPVITRRFMVVDPRVKVEGRVKRSSVIEQYFSHQEIPFSILHASYQIIDPGRELKVVIQQNHRWDNAIWGLQPLMMRTDELDYHYTDGRNSFEGGNEFRYFDTKSLRYTSERVARVENRNDGFHVTLLPDIPRTTKAYVTYSDINGQRLIKTEDARDSRTEAEYVWVDFFIPYKEPMNDGALYILGSLTDWQLSATTTSPGDRRAAGRMSYNFARRGYEARLYLKQGYYNYLYAFLPNGESSATLRRIEGSLYETHNTYTVLVYYREQGTRFDRLIAAEVIEN